MDSAQGHRHFSVDYFNRSWDLIDQAEKTPAENEQMLFMSIASHCHWQAQPDYDNTKASVGYWHTARVYALLGEGDNARAFAEKCLAVSTGDEVPAFYKAYAYEALARAYQVQGDQVCQAEALAKAQALSAQIASPSEKDALQADLATLG